MVNNINSIKADLEYSGIAYIEALDNANEPEIDGYYTDSYCYSYNAYALYNKDDKHPYSIGYAYQDDSGEFINGDPEGEIFFDTFEDMVAYINNDYKCPDGINHYDSEDE